MLKAIHSRASVFFLGESWETAVSFISNGVSRLSFETVSHIDEWWHLSSLWAVEILLPRKSVTMKAN